MASTDMIFGWVDSDGAHVEDRFAQGIKEPLLDTMLGGRSNARFFSGLLLGV